MAAKRKPAKVLRLSGTYRKDRHSDRVERVVEQVKPPRRPAFLIGSAAKEWTRVVGLMKENNTLHGLNVALLCQYCLMWQQLVESTEPGGEPLGAAFHTSYRLVSSELGFTPMAMLKMPKKGDKQDDKDDFDGAL